MPPKKTKETLMMKLYYAAQTRSTRPRAVLEELGVPYELIRVDLSKGEHQTPAYLKLHPLGKVPALQDGDLVVLESVAICMYLADKFPEKKLAPALDSTARGHYYKWLLFAASTLEPLIGTVFVNTIRLQEGPFLLGEQFSVADIIMGSMLAWARSLKLLEGYPNITAYLSRVTSRPSFQAARKD
jgi:glutathione S-transferase